jgi:hypothetical protein
MKANPNVDELLSSFIDGELGPRQRTEVQRMLAHDPDVVRRLRQLEKCKLLIGSLPRADAPSDMLEQIKTSLERRTLLEGQTLSVEAAQGARHLLMRRVLAAAAMLGLVAVLAGLVFTIVIPAPDNRSGFQMVAGGGGSRLETEPIGVVSRQATESGFWGRLELTTGSMVAANSFVNGAIEDGGLSNCVTLSGANGRKVYSLSCSREAVNGLLADLGGIWQRFDSSTLFVETKRFGEPVVIHGVTAEQTVEIAGQDNVAACVETARHFAVLNGVAQLMPAGELASVIGDIGEAKVDLIGMPKPVLTWPRGTIKRTPVPQGQGVKVNLTIVLVETK